MEQIDHSAWTGLLARYVKPTEQGLNRFAYASVTPDDRATLKAYITGLAALPISRYNRAEQQAYWINLYNALTIDVVLDAFPIESIRDIDISPGLFASGPWGKELVEIEGEGVTINDIEHRILRPIWRDPRVHYAVNCASVGCPNLQIEAFTAENSERLLDDGARAYINNPRGVRLDDGELVVSSLYNWYSEDFGGNEAGILAHLKRYADPKTTRILKAAKEIDDYEYDWTLNDAPG